MQHYDVVETVTRWALLLGSAALAGGSIQGMLARRRGYRALLAWALFIPVDIAWKEFSPGLPMSEQWHRFSYGLRMTCTGAWIMYGILYIPFLFRDSKAWKAERKRAAAASRDGQTP